MAARYKEELRDYPCYFRYLNFVHEVNECELLTEFTYRSNSKWLRVIIGYNLRQCNMASAQRALVSSGIAISAMGINY